MRSLYNELEASAIDFLEKARASTKASDAEAFFGLCERASQQARDIWRDLASNSILLFLELSTQDSYESYYDFCSRNNLLALSREDYHEVLSRL